MVKKILILLVIAAAMVCFWVYFRYLSPATQFQGNEKYLVIYSNNNTKEAVFASLQKDSLVKNTKAFDEVATRLKYWNRIKPGRYKIEKGMNLLAMVRMLRNGIQTPTKLVINKLRLTSDLARAISRAIETDSASIAALLSNKDSLANLGLTPENWSAYIIPNSYEVIWTTSAAKTIKKLKEEREKWWAKEDRKARAEAKNLSPEQVHIVASIVEEESNLKADRPIIASVYLNRIKQGMPLQADPTVRFALKDFVSNRVLFSHLRTPSPYNTYLNTGLPPGPICTPMASTLENVLDAPETDYIFFVANADLRGGSTFTTNLTDHNKAARIYQDSLTAWLRRKAVRKKAEKDSLERMNQKMVK